MVTKEDLIRDKLQRLNKQLSQSLGYEVEALSLERTSLIYKLVGESNELPKYSVTSNLEKCGGEGRDIHFHFNKVFRNSI